MRNFLKKHKWTMLAAGAAIQIFTGIPAAWGVFQQGVCEGYKLEENAAAMIFSLTIGAFGIGCVIGGFLQDKFGPRIAGIAGTVMLSAGFVCSSFLPQGAPWAFYLVFSAPVGVGTAFLYPAVMSCAQKWYADKKGLATGIIGGAVGASGAVLTLLGTWLIRSFKIRTAFFVLGIIMAVICGASCILLENPTDAKREKGESNDLPPLKMIKTKNWVLLFLATALSTPAVLLFSPVIVQLAQQRGLDENAGLICIAAGSAASALGRLLMPWLSDKAGRKWVDFGLLCVLCGGSFLFKSVQGIWLIAVYSLLTFCYSGQAAVLPSFVTDLFGKTHSGINYGFAALGMTAGSIGFPLLAQLIPAKHMIAIIAAGLGAMCMVLVSVGRADHSPP